MFLKEIHIDGFRNLAVSGFSPGAAFNLFIGKNAQGKSNFLEALYSLGLGRSYRTGHEEQVVRDGASFARVAGAFSDPGGDFSLELVWERLSGAETSGSEPPSTRSEGLKKTIRFNGSALSRLSDFIDKAPMVLLAADDLELVRGAPDVRRKYLDLLCSRLYPSQVADLREYRRILELRNLWLKMPAEKQDKYLGEVYLEKLLDLGSATLYRRFQTLDALKPHLSELYEKIFGEEMPEIRYNSSIKGIRERSLDGIKTAYRETMARMAKGEAACRYTLAGPHRDDFDLRRESHSVKNYASLGEIRSASVVLKLAEMEVISGRTGKHPIVLIDDCLNEFDPRRVALFLDFILCVGQIFYTTTRAFPYSEKIKDISTFQVSGGEITSCSPYQSKAV